MPRSLTKVIYKPDPQSTEEYTVIVDPQQYNKWKNGDTSIPISDVVDSFTVLHSTQGAQGILGQASRQQLENEFGTHKDVEVVQQILTKGRAQTGSIEPNAPGSTNITRGNFGDPSQPRLTKH